MTEQLENIARLRKLIIERHVALPPCDYSNDLKALHYRAAVDTLTRELETEGLVIRVHGDTTSVRFSGIRATSTGGVVQALHNWKAAAEKKMAGGAA